MKIIAHRANINGPNNKNENTLDNIQKCIRKGYDVEIDIRVIEGILYLGHDKPERVINMKELFEIKEKSWIHCKNLEAIEYFSSSKECFNYFFHDKDPYTLTSCGYIWAYPGKKLSPRCICVLPELNSRKNDIKSYREFQITGICTDYPNVF